ncbi:DegT/DnrJ/EryC1/StrS family aminotransferase [Phenylobacterium sp.]|uniref:DegT/DnrJ/EryC1/StrS family aminotransferase n=1 Tax=Phenylobacterium sp. TaxID=1871053 RepID=UPI002C4ED5CE|nr:DegT/DnrJ/EryC1/StrS family aminotransferase [Phenylobacterium sp.]HVI34557.1 DegT/DnrJ/EryC1/StrS family aminotransferase [Phenylobacterium sp.]
MRADTPRKLVQGPADLAINGARPAFAEPLHVGRPNVADRDLYLARIEAMLDSGWLTNNGPMVHEFEARLAESLDVRHVVAVCNATIALEIAIRALGLTGEVIVPSYTFIATAHAVYWQGLTPVFADIDPETHCLDPASVERMITPRTSGIIGVHLWGRTAPTEALQDLADRHGLKLMYDAAHAFGVTRGGRRVGSFGACEVFSFHATKFLNSLEGGAVATNDDDLAHTLRLMRNFGFVGYDDVIHPGTNGKMVEACAAMGLVNLAGSDGLIATNARNHAAYARGLAGITGVSLLTFDPGERNNYQYVVAEVGPEAGASRDELVATLTAENVLARKYFWPGCHRMKPYRDLFPSADAHLPATNQVAARVLVLPTGSSVGEEDIAAITAIIRTRCGPP